MAASLMDYAREAARRAGIDENLFVAQIQQESGFNPNAVSPAGAKGIAQIMPNFHPGVDTSDPYASLDYAANLDASNLKKFGNTRDMLVAYNAGPGRAGLPDDQLPAETRGYLSKILGGATSSQAQSRSTPAQPVGATGNPAPQSSGPSARPSAPSPLALQLLRGGANPRAVEILGLQQQPGPARPANITRPAGATAAPVAQAGANITPDQFGDKTLTPEEAYAACGPAAAVALAQGKVTLRQALDLAKQTGWTPQGGMNGIGNEKKLLDQMGIASRIDANPSADAIVHDASTGNPVIVSTPGHYFVLNGYDDKTKKFYAGKSGTAYKAGSEWLTLDEIRRLGGGLNGALFTDHPGSPTPSVAAT